MFITPCKQSTKGSDMFFHIANTLVSAVLHHCMTEELKSVLCQSQSAKRRMEQLPKAVVLHSSSVPAVCSCQPLCVRAVGSLFATELVLQTQRDSSFRPA